MHVTFRGMLGIVPVALGIYLVTRPAAAARLDRARLSRCGDHSLAHRRLAHFRQSAADLRATFDPLGFGSRLKLLEPGVRTVIEA